MSVIRFPVSPPRLPRAPDRALVAKIPDGRYANFRVRAPDDLGTPTVELLHTMLILLTHTNAEAYYL